MHRPPGAALEHRACLVGAQATVQNQYAFQSFDVESVVPGVVARVGYFDWSGYLEYHFELTLLQPSDAEYYALSLGGNAFTVFALDRESGEANHFDQTLSDEDLERVVQSLSNLAKNGPHPPLNALRQPSICKKCGYQQLCYKKNYISPHTLSTL